MKDWKAVCRKLLFIPCWLTIILTIICGISLVAIFINGWETSLIAYIMYVLSFYTLTVICIICWKKIPGYYKRAKERVHKNEHADRYFSDEVFKNRVNLYGSLAVSLIYVVVNAISGIVYKTHWFGIFAVYYGIMAIMRFLLIRYVDRNQVGKARVEECRRSRLCAYILLTVNLTLSGVVLMMVYLDRGFHYRGFLIYVMAMYTFYITTMAIIEIVKYRRYNSPVMSISKIIKLASALFSMLFLETAMFAQFGESTSQRVKRIMIMATGAGICVIVVVMAIYVIVRTTKEIRKLRRQNKVEGEMFYENR